MGIMFTVSCLYMEGLLPCNSNASGITQLSKTEGAMQSIHKHSCSYMLYPLGHLELSSVNCHSTPIDC
jgi:hypothetical protein